MKRTLQIGILFLICVSTWAQTPGFSFHGGTTSVVSMNTANLTQATSWRVEFQIHTGGTSPTITYPFTNTGGWMDDNGTGLHNDIVSGAGSTSLLQATDARDLGGGTVCQVNLSANSLIRAQRIYLTTSATFQVESWNIDGTNYSVCNNAGLGLQSWAFSGGGINATAPVNIGFYRIFTCTVSCGSAILPLNSARPTTADGSSYLECKLDNTLACSVGTSFTHSSGSAETFFATPGLTAYATVKTFGAPFWTTATSFRAGNVNQLDASGSLSMTPASSSVTHFWQALSCSGGFAPFFSSHSNAQPTVFGLTFGTCQFQDTVTDLAGNSASQTLPVGAVATDLNNIVIDQNQAFSDAVFGQQIAFGHNPWPYSDWANMNAVNVVGALIGGPTSGLSFSDDWNAQLPGTVSVTGTTMTFTSVNTQTTFCNGTTNWAGNFPIPVLYAPDPINIGRPGGIGRVPVSPVGPNGCPTSSTITIDTTSEPFPYTGSVCTVAAPCNFGKSVNWLFYLGQNGTASPGYYNGAAMFEAYRRRSGLDSVGQLGLQLVTQQVTAPAVDQCVVDYQQARYLPTLQWAIAQIYYPTNSAFSAFQFGLRQCAQHFGYLFIPPGYAFSSYSQIVNGSVLNCRASGSMGGFCSTDTRENGAAAIDAAAAAYVETDPAWQSTLNQIIAGAWSNMFGPQLQSDGHWDQSMGGAASSPTAMWTQNSQTVTAFGSNTFPSTQCNTIATPGGTLSIVNGATTITASVSWAAVSPVTTSYIVIKGTFSGVYGKQVVGLISVSGTTVTIAQPINLDTASGLNYYLSNGSANPMFVVIKTDTSGNAMQFTPDSNWYSCTWVDSNHLTLDQNFQIPSQTGVIVYNGSDQYTLNQGNQPFMEAFPTAAFELASLLPVDNANGLTSGVLTAMKSAARGLYPFMSTTAWNPAFKGVYYATEFGDCVPQFSLSIGCGSVQQNVRMFGVETNRALAAALLNAPTSAKNTFLTQYYGAQWGNLAYGSSPYSDGSFVDDCADGFTTGSFTKYAFQCFAIGSSASMPAALAGGLAPASMFSLSVPFLLTKPFAGTDHVTVELTAPSGAFSSTSFTTSPAVLSIDARQGQHWMVIKYWNGVALLGQTQALLVNPS